MMICFCIIEMLSIRSLDVLYHVIHVGSIITYGDGGLGLPVMEVWTYAPAIPMQCSAN